MAMKKNVPALFKKYILKRIICHFFWLFSTFCIIFLLFSISCVSLCITYFLFRNNKGYDKNNSFRIYLKMEYLSMYRKWCRKNVHSNNISIWLKLFWPCQMGGWERGVSSGFRNSDQFWCAAKVFPFPMEKYAWSNFWNDCFNSI